MGKIRPRKVLLERRISNLKQSAGKDEHFDKKKKLFIFQQQFFYEFIKKSNYFPAGILLCIRQKCCQLPEHVLRVSKI